MALFRIHRMKENPRQQFRWAPHVAGVANARPKDYEPAGEVDAENEYAAWALLRNSDSPLGVGDILEFPESRLRICKYVGFEEARWSVPEVPTKPDGEAAVTGAAPEAPPVPTQSGPVPAQA